MRKNLKYILKAGIITIIAASSLTGCGGVPIAPMNNNYSAANDLAVNGMAESKAMAYDEGSYDSYNESYSEPQTSEADIVKSTMMIVRDANVSLDVGNLEEFNKNLESNVEKFGGYFESATVNNYDSEWSSERYAYFTVRIPEKKLDDFLNIIDGETSVTSKSITSEDVSLEYVDTEARIQALEQEKKSLLELMDKADTTADIIEIQNRLTDVQYELDSKNNQKRTLEGRVAYSTVNITAKEERNVEHPIRQAFEVNFKEKLLEGLETTVEVVVWIITKLPVVVIVTVFIAFIVLLFSTVFKKVWGFIFRRKDGVRYMLVPTIIEEKKVKKEASVKNTEDKETTNL